MEYAKNTILIIEDEFVALAKMKVMLKDFGTCDAATFGEQALKIVTEKARERKYYKLITIDIGLPDMDGIDLLNKIEKIEKDFGRESKKIIITASGTAENVVRAFQSKCADFIVKPVKRNVLIEKVKKMNIY